MAITQEHDDLPAITRDDFVLWKEHVVTRHVFSLLEAVLSDVEEQRLAKSVLKDPNGLLRLNELYGYGEAIRDVLNLDIEENDHEKN